MVGLSRIWNETCVSCVGRQCFTTEPQEKPSFFFLLFFNSLILCVGIGMYVVSQPCMKYLKIKSTHLDELSRAGASG